MKYIHIYDTLDDYVDITKTYPDISLIIGKNNFVIFNHDYIIYEREYLTFEVLTSGTIGWKLCNSSTFSKTIQYSINNSDWVNLTSISQGVYISNLSKGDLVRIKGENEAYGLSNGDYNAFEGGTAKYNVYGNIMSLIYGDNFINKIELPSTYTFRGLFDKSKVVSAEHLILPADVLTEHCYRALFANASSLITAAPLPATTLAESCYRYMFDNDSSLVNAPELLAKTLVDECYLGMFHSCSSLNKIKCLATDISANNCLSSWVNGVCDTGLFIKEELTTWPKGMNGIPNGWSVTEIFDNEIPNLYSWKYSNNSIKLPYSINGIDGHSSSYSKGAFTFTAKVILDEVQTTYLWFQHADQSAEIYVDDVFVTKHWGGYNAFFVDISEYVHTGVNNIKVIIKNNEGNNLAPAEADFNFNATLGNVELLTSPVLPATLYGYDGFHISSTVSSTQAEVTIKTSIPVEARVVCTIDDGTYHWSDEITDSGDITFNHTILNPHLWDGVNDPHLYNISIQIYYNNLLCYASNRDYGFRYYSYVINDTSILQSSDPYTGFLLNGHPYLLRGVCMHQDIEGKANALSNEDIAHDFDIITELGANFIRTAHYPHPKEFYDFCDRLGIVVQTEVPCVNKLHTTMPEDYYTHLTDQYIDMVNQHYNHPCIIFWGLSNETTTDDKEFAKQKIEQYAALIKSLDSERWVGYVLAQSPSSNPSGYYNNPSNIDWFGCNIYVGWYDSPNSNTPTSQLTSRLNNTVTKLGKPMAYSEYGCGGNIYCHSDDPLTTTTRGNNPRHDIEYMMWLHEGHIATIKNFPQLLYTSQWVLFDFAVTKRREGYITCLDGINTVEDESFKYLNDKGLVCRDHITKKDPFYLYKAWWNTTDKFVHICQKNYQKNVDRVIKCYTNDGDTLSLYVNNTFIETVTVSNNIAMFSPMDFILDDIVRVDGATTSDTFIFSAVVEILNRNWGNNTDSWGNDTDKWLK